MKCLKCGNELSETCVFCGKCGTRVPAKAEYVSSDKKSKGNTGVIITVLAVVLAVVVFACAALYIFVINSDEDSDTGNKTKTEETNDMENDDLIERQEDVEAQQPDEVIVEQQPSEPETDVPGAKAEEYMLMAREIEQYSDDYYKTETDQATLNIESYNVYIKWDELLNEVYDHLSSTMPEIEFKALEADEIDWIAEKEAAIDEAAAGYEGGSMESLIRNNTAIAYTQQRCYYLISLVE